MDEEKRKENEEVEEVESINENDLKNIIKEAVKESQKESKRPNMITQEMLDAMVEERMKEVEEARKTYNQRLKEAEDKYKGLSKKEKVLKILEDEKEKILIQMNALDPEDPKYDEKYQKKYDNYRKLNESYEDVRRNPLRKVDWTRVITTLIIIGAAGALVFLLLIIENSAYFPRSRNALNLIMSLLKVGIKL